MSDEFEHDAAPYLLGSLDPQDRAAFAAHLAGCPDCAARVDELRPTVQALRTVHDAGALDAPPELLPELLRRAAAERRRRRRIVGGTGLLAAAAVVALLLVIVLGGRSSSPPDAARAFRPVQQTSRIHATAALVDRRWGTQIDVRCRYDSGFAPGVPYELVVIDTSHGRHPAGSWRLVPGRDTTYTGGVEVPRARIAAVQITLPDGRPILELDLQ